MRNNLRNELLTIVRDINARYESFRSLSNDELRDKLYKIEVVIDQSPNQNETLNVFLPEVYAIVKETARRFSEGNIIVTANENDKLLADCYSFVKIEDDKAVYLNTWDAYGQVSVWNMIHYDEQLMGGILLHKGYAVEMATGEGKTLVATLPVFLNALTHKGVHLMTANGYLSKRDCEQTRPLYMLYGLSADCIEYYSRSDKRKKEAYTKDITFGTNSSFVFDYLFDHLEIDPKMCVQGQHHFAMVDELDSILIDNADEPHVIGGGNYYDNGKVYKESIGIIKELILNKSLYKVNKLYSTATFTAKGKKWLENKSGIKNLFSFHRSYEINEFEKLSEEERTDIEERFVFQNVYNQLLYALVVLERDVDYIVDGNKVKIIDKHTGRVKEKSRWEHGLHTAVEVKEGVDTQEDFEGMAVISLKNYFKLYDAICGMSGTIMPVEKELSEIYGLKCAALPPHKPCIREDLPMQVFKTKEEKDAHIVEYIQNIKNSGRPCLVGNTTVKRTETIGGLLSEKGIEFNRLDAKTEKNEALIIANAGVGNTITVSTSIAGRGTDIKPSEAALAHGGLAVIGTDLFESSRIDRQLIGRSGRQGNPGSSVFFVSLEDIILNNLSKRDVEKLRNVSERVYDGNYNIPDIRVFFKKAQSNRELYLKKLRKETARKDDIVAPRRLKFYNQRKRVLFDASAADSIITEILKGSTHTHEEMNEHLHELYIRTKELTVRSIWNNKDRQIIIVPFSDNMYTYAVRFDVNLIQSGFNYFCSEYKRQVILHIYDKQWKQFVIYMMGNLDRTEIGKLDEKYDLMMKDIEAAILSRLFNATIPFGGRPDVLEPAFIEVPNSPILKTNQDRPISPNDPCPCKSGKKYSECHGKDIRCNRTRR